jgi:hypothetical protein
MATFAFLYRFGPYDEKIVGVSRADLLENYIIPMLRYVTATHVTDTRVTHEGSKCGNEWQTAYHAAIFARAAWWIWVDLPENVRQDVRRVVTFEAKRFIGQKPPHNIEGDTKSEANETYSVVLSNAVGADLSVSTGTGTINNDDNVPALSINNVNGNEGQAFSFVVTLSAPSGLTVTVPFSTLGVSATAGQDFTATSGTVTFAPGVVQQTVVVQTLGDAALEPSETFQVVLGVPVNATINTGTGTGTIADVPPQVLLVLEGASGNEGDAGTTNFVFVASLSGATTVPVIVTW